MGVNETIPYNHHLHTLLTTFPIPVIFADRMGSPKVLALLNFRELLWSIIFGRLQSNILNKCFIQPTAGHPKLWANKQHSPACMTVITDATMLMSKLLSNFGPKLKRESDSLGLYSHQRYFEYVVLYDVSQ